MNVPAKPASRFRRLGALAASLAIFAGALGASGAAQAAPGDFAFSSVAASLSTQAAGGHPDFVTDFRLDGNPIKFDFVSQPFPTEALRETTVELPPGLTGNPAAFPTCSTAVYLGSTVSPAAQQCPTDSQVGLIAIGLHNASPPDSGFVLPVFNLEPPGGDVVARLGVPAAFWLAVLDIRVDPKRENALTATITAPSHDIGKATGAITTIWGVPTDPSHDNKRMNIFDAFLCGDEPCGGPQPSGIGDVAFMSNPTSCGPQEVGFRADSYMHPDLPDIAFASVPDITGCESVPFQPTLSLKPTTRSAAAASGVDFSLRVPQGGLTDPRGLASAHLKKAVITMPEGVSLNASAADGLGSCSQDQIGVDYSERQIVALGSRGAPVVLSFGGQSTAELPHRASAAAVQAALEALPNIAPGDIAVSGADGGPWEVDFAGSLGDVPEITGTHSELLRLAVRATGGTFTLTFDGQTTGATGTGDVANTSATITNVATGTGAFVVGEAIGGTGIPAGTKITAVDTGAQTITLSQPATAAGAGVALTANLPFNAAATPVQAALEALSNIAPGDIAISGGPAGFPGEVMRIVFTGPLSQTDVPAITATKSLSGSRNFARVDVFANGAAAALVKTTKQGGTLGFDAEDPTCPDSSKVGSGTITTPLLPDPLLDASLYLADQNDNPFNSLLSGYMVARGKGVIIKVAGKFDLDPQTGRLTATFDNNPQQPFSDLELHFKGGNRGVITTPSACGTYQVDYELTPWSGNAPTVGTSVFTIDQNCNAGGFAPGFSAASTNPLAGAFTSFALQVTRNSGSPQLTGVTVNPPLGLTGKLAGIPYCSDAALASIPSGVGTGTGQLASPACPVASQVGTVVAGAGSGSPFYVDTGKVYLAGPYKGAPLSMAIATPAVAGPFDLGNVLVRTAIHIDPRTAQLQAISDPLPTILSGIPLDLRDVRVNLDRQGFALNPTSCEEKSATGVITGTGGASANVSDRFQVGECAALGFKPRMSLRLRGGTTRGKHPALTAILRPRPGDANISEISVAFPRSEFLENAHIRTVCTRPDFAADNCPKGAIYGQATVTTPLLDVPLTGPIYLRSSDNLLPDLVPDLRGPASLPIKLESAGRTDSIRGGIRNTFDFVPDAPFTKLVVRLQGGRKGLLVNSRNICERVYRATIEFGAHNGRTYTASPALNARCGARGKKGNRLARASAVR